MFSRFASALLSNVFRSGIRRAQTVCLRFTRGKHGFRTRSVASAAKEEATLCSEPAASTARSAIAGMGLAFAGLWAFSTQSQAKSLPPFEQESPSNLVEGYNDYHKDVEAKYPNLHVLRLDAQLLALHSIIRDRSTARDDFVFYSNRINRLLVERALSRLNFAPSVIMTPTNIPFKGAEFRDRVVGISIMRAGDSMVAGLRSVAKGVRIGKVLIQRDEEDPEKKSALTYKKLPKDISERSVLLLDPMLATGGSAKLAIKTLIDEGVNEERITFVNVVANPVGIEALFEAYPNIQMVTSFVDPALNKQKYIIPGLGDFGDRYFGTEEDQHGRRTYTYH